MTTHFSWATARTIPLASWLLLFGACGDPSASAGQRDGATDEPAVDSGVGGRSGSGGVGGRSGVGGRTGSGGAATGSGGVATGSGGRIAGSGGVATGSGGRVTGSGGVATGSGGRIAGSGGVATGSGGRITGSGGVATGSGGAACPDALVGWATVAGDGVPVAAGGGNATPVRPQTASELLDYASDDTPRVIEIAGTFEVPKLQVNSNKTLVGIGSNATINGGLRIRGYSSSPVSNVIVRNLRVNGATTAVDNDAVQLYFAHHVWIDHCEIWDGPDGNLDMTHAVSWVTVSWTKFRYTSAYQRPSGESSDHRFCSLIGHSDSNAGEDSGRLKITFHHDWWAEGVIERMPRVRFGQVHVFNNYFSSAANNYCVRAGRGAQLLIEGNYFDGVNSPHEFNSSEDEATASITVRNNTYVNATGNKATGGGGPAFTSVPYTADIEPAAGIPGLVKACAGPR